MRVIHRARMSPLRSLRSRYWYDSECMTASLAALKCNLRSPCMPCEFEDLLVARTPGDASLDSCHGVSSRLQVGRQAANCLDVRRRHLVLHVHDALALAALVLEHVRLEGLATHHLAGAGDVKALLCRLMRPNLRHWLPSAARRLVSLWSCWWWRAAWCRSQVWPDSWALASPARRLGPWRQHRALWTRFVAWVAWLEPPPGSLRRA